MIQCRCCHEVAQPMATGTGFCAACSTRVGKGCCDATTTVAIVIDLRDRIPAALSA